MLQRLASSIVGSFADKEKEENLDPDDSQDHAIKQIGNFGATIQENTRNSQMAFVIKLGTGGDI
jgi:hypothetical protein